MTGVPPYARRLLLATLVAAAYVGVVSPLRGWTARGLAAGLAHVAAADVRVGSTRRPPAVVAALPDRTQRSIAVPFGRLWITTAVALAALGAPRRAHGALAVAVAALGLATLATAAVALSGVSPLWHAVAFLAWVEVPLVVGTAFLAARPPGAPGPRTTRTTDDGVSDDRRRTTDHRAGHLSSAQTPESA